MLRAVDLRSASDRAGECLAEALTLSFVALELDEVAGDERRLAIPLRDGATVLGTLVVPAVVTHSDPHTFRRLRQDAG